MVRVVDNFPLVLSRVEHGLNGENRHNLLLVTLDVVLEVKKSCFDRALESLLKATVKLFHGAEPLTLDRWTMVHEQVLVSLDEELADCLKRVLEELLLDFELILLNAVELVQFVHFLFDMGQNRG